MEIVGDDYKLTPSKSDGALLWDLELLYEIKSKSGGTRTEFKNAGYGYTLKSAIKRIINYRITSKEETITLKEYLTRFQKEVDKLSELLSSDID